MERFSIASSWDSRLNQTYALQCFQGDTLVSVAEIAPDFGFNLYRWSVCGQEIIHCDRDELVETGFSGIPILYPAPNRTSNGCFTFQDKTYQMEKNGQIRNIHGLVYDEPWHVDACTVSEDCCQISADICFAEGSALYQAFPFAHRLRVSYCLTAHALTLTYTVQNQSEQAFPFGLGIHTYFVKQDPDVSLCVPTERMFWSDELHFPHAVTGVDRAGYDLRDHTPVNTLRLDDVYTDLAGVTSEIKYPNQRTVLQICGSDVFKNAVVFTPVVKPYFCYENQTCMTNALNAEREGLQDVSGLLISQPNSEQSGTVQFCWNPLVN